MTKNGLKQRLQSLSDNELRTLILSITAAAGLSSDSVRTLTADIPALRRKLSALGDGEITALLSAIGTPEAENAIKNLNSKKY